MHMAACSHRACCRAGRGAKIVAWACVVEIGIYHCDTRPLAQCLARGAATRHRYTRSGRRIALDCTAQSTER
eukprot:7350694-Prymnesium_polylepis.1